MENWYLACHKTGKHNAFKAQMFLAQMKVVAFIPQIFIFKPRSDRAGQFKRVMEPLFHGYMFIYFDPNVVHTSKISSCPGISHLVRFNNTITPVNESIVEAIMKLPVCVSESIPSKKIHFDSGVKKHTPLSRKQHMKLMKLVAEKDGVSRSAMLYAFAEASFLLNTDKQNTTGITGVLHK